MLTRHAITLTLLPLVLACSDADETTPPGADGSPGAADAAPGTPDAQTAACADLAGSWAISGGCGADLCAITQAGCQITQVSCASGASSSSGSISGDMFTYSGTSGGGVPSTCSGTASGNSIAGTCTTPGGPCSFTGARQ